MEVFFKSGELEDRGELDEFVLDQGNLVENHPGDREDFGQVLEILAELLWVLRIGKHGLANRMVVVQFGDDLLHRENHAEPVVELVEHGGTDVDLLDRLFDLVDFGLDQGLLARLGQQRAQQLCVVQQV